MGRGRGLRRDGEPLVKTLTERQKKALALLWKCRESEVDGLFRDWCNRQVDDLVGGATFLYDFKVFVEEDERRAA